MNILSWLLLIALLFVVFIRYLLKPIVKWGISVLARRAAESLKDQTRAYQRNYGNTRHSAQQKVHLKDDLEVIIPEKATTKVNADLRYSNVEDVEFED